MFGVIFCFSMGKLIVETGVVCETNWVTVCVDVTGCVEGGGVICHVDGVVDVHPVIQTKRIISPK